MAVNFINKYPYTDFHELNLDWIIKELSKKAAGRWVTITIHPDEWDGGGSCTVSGIDGMTAETPFMWNAAPENGTADVYPSARGDGEITFQSSGPAPVDDVIIYLLIGE